MRRLCVVCALAMPLLGLTTAGPAGAEVKPREKATVKIEALPGWMMRMMGARKEGILSSTAGKGNRKVTATDNMVKKPDAKPLATIMTTQIDVEEIATSVPAADLELPPGFKEKK